MKGVESFFSPRSIAVAGVSVDPSKVASVIFSNLVRNAKSGLLKASVYAINPRYRKIGEQPCYKDVDSLPEVPELFVVAVPLALTVDLVRQACNRGSKAIIIITGGFGEAGHEDLEAEIRSITSSKGVRVLGPNTIGLLDTSSGVDTLFLPTTKKLPSGREVVSLRPPAKGGVVIVTQSGHLGEIIAEELGANQIGVRALVGVGNQLDVSIGDVVEHFADDPETKLMALYLEGLKDGRRFLREVSRAAKNKPVVVFKLGKSQAGAKAALTHTASMVGDYQVYRAAFRKVGLLEAETLEDLVDYCTALSLAPAASGERILIITNAGGSGAIAADKSNRMGLQVEPLSERAANGIKSRFADSSFIRIVSLSNPVDLTATATTEEFVAISEYLVRSPEYDLMVVIPTHQPPTIEYSIVEGIVRVAKKAKKPVVTCVMGTSELAHMLHSEFLSNGVPSFPSPERAVGALWALVQRKKLRAGISPPEELRSDDIVPWLKERKGFLVQPDASRLLDEYRIDSGRSMMATSKEDLAKAVRTIGFPLACKLLSRDLIHKTEKNAVRLNVKSRAELVSAFEELRALAAQAKLQFDGVLVQEMLENGVEMILGSLRDPTFGPTVMLGIGGVYTEVLKDFAMGVAPVDESEASDMIASLRMGTLLRGFRNVRKADEATLAAVVARFSKMLVENPSLKEAEINPLIAVGGRMVAVDSRIVVR
ncbi:MAG: acetate--CoA ligase family protein [Conexivisphaerales archaeon]